MEKYLDDVRAVEVEVGFEVLDGTVSLVPDRLFVPLFLGKCLVAKILRMHPDDQHLFVVRTIEDPDSPPLR